MQVGLMHGLLFLVKLTRSESKLTLGPCLADDLTTETNLKVSVTRPPRGGHNLENPFESNRRMEKTHFVVIALLVCRCAALARVAGRARATPSVATGLAAQAARRIQSFEGEPNDGFQGRAAAMNKAGVGAAQNRAYMRAKQEARAAANREQKSLEEWTTATEREAVLPQTIAPEVASGGVSALLGFCSGKACRVVSDAAALGLGAAFVFVTLLSRAGYVTINYTITSYSIRHV